MMIVLLVLYFLFLFIYAIINIYGIFKLLKMRMPKDKTPIAVILYLIVISAIMLTSIILIISLSWRMDIIGALGLGG